MSDLLDRPRAAMDPGKDAGNTRVTYDGKNTRAVASIASWVGDHRGYLLVTESSFGSYVLEDRERILAVAESNDVAVRTVSPRTTAHRRRELEQQTGVKQIKSDDLDCLMIWRTAFERGAHLKVPRPYREMTPDEALASAQHRERQRRLRTSGYSNEDGVRFYGLLAARCSIEPVLYVACVTKPSDKKAAVLNRSFVLPLAVAADHLVALGGNERGFDRMVGAYSHGYPSLLRSNFYFHRVKALAGRPGWDRKKAMRACRRASRRIFQIVRDESSGMRHVEPANGGKSNPLPLDFPDLSMQQVLF